MPNIKSSELDIQRTKKRTLRNRMVKSSLKTAIRKANAAIAAGDADQASACTKQAVRLIDKAAAKGVIHKNNAARKKSQIVQRCQKAAS